MADIAPYPGVLASLEDIAEVVTMAPDESTLRDVISEFDAYFASLKVILTEEIIARGNRLKVVGTNATGTDHIDLEALTRRGIPYIGLKHETAFLDDITATAEMAWALLLGTVRKLPWSHAASCRGEWARDRFRGHQLSGMTCGILGYGRLGRMVADYAKAFRMQVIACDTENVTPSEGVAMVDFDTLLARSDVLSIHIHLTEANRCLFTEETFDQMKPGAVLVNTSRGGILDEEAFVRALSSGRLGGAGVDVIDGEWNDDLSTHPLIQYARSHENLVISPHTGGVTYESQASTIEFTAQKMRAVLVG
jgi:D-3-phosphoglycerate dehydrogenase